MDQELRSRPRNAGAVFDTATHDAGDGGRTPSYDSSTLWDTHWSFQSGVRRSLFVGAVPDGARHRMGESCAFVQ